MTERNFYRYHAICTIITSDGKQALVDHPTAFRHRRRTNRRFSSLRVLTLGGAPQCVHKITVTETNNCVRILCRPGRTKNDSEMAWSFRNLARAISVRSSEDLVIRNGESYDVLKSLLSFFAVAALTVVAYRGALSAVSFAGPRDLVLRRSPPSTSPRVPFCTSYLTSIEASDGACPLNRSTVTKQLIDTAMPNRSVAILGDSRGRDIFMYLKGLLEGRLLTEPPRKFKQDVLYYDKDLNTSLEFYWIKYADVDLLKSIVRWTTSRNRTDDVMIISVGAWSVDSQTLEQFTKWLEHISYSLALLRKQMNAVWVPTLPVKSPEWFGRQNSSDYLDSLGKLIAQSAFNHKLSLWSTAQVEAKKHLDLYHDPAHPGPVLLQKFPTSTNTLLGMGLLGRLFRGLTLLTALSVSFTHGDPASNFPSLDVKIHCIWDGTPPFCNPRCPKSVGFVLVESLCGSNPNMCCALGYKVMCCPLTLNLTSNQIAAFIAWGGSSYQLPGVYSNQTGLPFIW